MVTVFNFLRDYQLCFKVAAPFSISISKGGGFPFPHIFTTTCYYPSFFNTVIWGRRQWHLTPILLPGKSHGRRSLVGCCPWGREESDTTERLHFHVSLSCIGVGNGNPLQCSCLENRRDRGAWWAAVYGVTQRQTRLRRLSSSSSNVSYSYSCQRLQSPLILLSLGFPNNEYGRTIQKSSSRPR